MIAQESMQVRWAMMHRRLKVEQRTQERYQVQTSQGTEDPIWDAFLDRMPGSSHVQTSTWARVKAIHGWQAERVMIMQGDEIVAGAQLLMGPLPIAGNIGGKVGYVTKGPILTKDDPELIKLMMNTYSS